MAGTVALAKQSENRGPVRPIAKFTISWISDSGGNANGALAIPIGGEVQRIVFVPSGTVAPSNNYAVTLKDENLLDILSGQGTNLSNTTATEICPSVAMKDGTTTSTRPRAIDDILTVSVTSAGNAKQGSVVLYIR